MPTPIEAKIIDYLVEKYNPEAIILGGSRASGLASKDSDWDLFILGGNQHKGGFFEFEGELLDITFKEWPKEDGFLTIPFGPLWPVKFLYDQSNNRLKKVLLKTKEAYEKGPLNLYKEACLERFEKLTRWQQKIQKHENNTAIQFFYAGIFYEFIIRAWFELRNQWPLPPAQALSHLKEQDKEFYELLQTFSTSAQERSELTIVLIKKVQSSLSRK